MPKLIRTILELPRQPILLSIKLYQRIISPDHGLLRHRHPYGFCRFYPSCSQYGYESIKKHGLIIGVPRAIWRILRCNPWSKGGIDLP